MANSIIHSDLLSSVPGIVCGFGHASEPIPEILSSSWNQKPDWEQVHGTDWARVDHPHQACGKVDALFTETFNIPISIKTADCVPILMSRRDGKMIAAIHAGWRGVKARIVKVVWRHLESLGQKPGDWVATIGPAIGPCCYPVSEELAQEFQYEFSKEYEKSLFAPEKNVLDLPALEFEELKGLGLLDVELLRYCTSCCKSPRFFSYRRDKNPGRQFTGLMKMR